MRDHKEFLVAVEGMFNLIKMAFWFWMDKKWL